MKLNINKNSVDNFSLIPYNQCKTEPKIEFLENNDKDIFLNKINEYSEVISNSDLLEKNWQGFCDSRKHEYLLSLLSLGKFRKQLLKNKKILRLVLKKKYLTSLLNLIRCEAHRDCILDIFENYLKED